MNTKKNQELPKRICKVDARPPLLPLSVVRKPEKMRNLQMFTKALDLLNFTYFQTLLTIHVRGGIVNSFREEPMPKGYSRKKQMANERFLIRQQNRALYETIAATAPIVPTRAELNKEWLIKKKDIHDYHVDHIYRDLVASEPPPPNVVQYITEKSTKYKDKRPRVHFEISVKGEGLFGDFVVMLYSDYVPVICESFIKFIKDWEAGFPRFPTGGAAVYRIFPKFLFLTGLEDSLSRPVFPQDKANSLKHAEPGVLSTYNIFPNINGTQIAFSFCKKPVLDDKLFPFGKIIKGFKTLREMEQEGTELSGYPKTQFFVSKVEEV